MLVLIEERFLSLIIEAPLAIAIYFINKINLLQNVCCSEKMYYLNTVERFK